MNLFLEDEIAASYLKNKRDMEALCTDIPNIYVINHSGVFGWMLAAAFSHVKAPHSLTLVQKEDASEIEKQIAEKYQVQQASPNQITNSWDKPGVYFFCCDLSRNDIVVQEKQWHEDLKQWASRSAECTQSRFLFVPLLPEIPEIPSPAQAIAEVEFSLWISTFGPQTPEGILFGLEQQLGDLVRKKKINCTVQEVRVISLFGPGLPEPATMPLSSMLRSAQEKDEITVGKRPGIYSYTYVRSAIKGMIRVLRAGRNGHIYHCASFRRGIHDIAYAVSHEIFGNRVRLVLEAETEEPQYHCFSTTKIKKIRYQQAVSCFYEAIFRTCGYLAEAADYPINRLLPIYDGKLPILKQLEIEMVSEIDRICKKYDIKYFLAGGSLLGAIRHHGFIPWDDDLDVAMLREDYEKFCKVCPEELPEKYEYVSYRTSPNTHYPFDKIRLKNTYFSTSFSEHFQDIENGVFLDILIYDKTSDDPAKQMKQLRKLKMFARALNVRWWDSPRKNVHYHISKILLPFMRCLPFEWYHKRFEKVAQKYRYADTHFLIDTVGQNLMKGAFPAEWFDDVVYVPFENIELPVPAGYDGYLRHWYGEHYMELLPLSMRLSGHQFARVDMGEYLWPESNQPSWAIDKRGELWTDYSEWGKAEDSYE